MVPGQMIKLCTYRWFYEAVIVVAIKLHEIFKTLSIQIRPREIGRAHV